MTSTLTIKEQKSLKPFTSWEVGGLAEYYCAPKTIEELKQALLAAHKNQWPMTILGGGTNVLVSDSGVSGLVIHTIHLNKVQVLSSGKDLEIEAEAGAQKSDVLKHFMKFRLAPAVFLAGLPGDMAGGVVMNAGVGHKVSPREFVEIVKSFEVLNVNTLGDIEVKTFNRDEVTWKYRKSLKWQPGVISKVRVSWPNEPDDSVLKSVRDGNRRRKDSQPLALPSCGSVFKNPEGDHAGRLIEDCGLKGHSIGGAQVSEKHANFIVNKGGATATQIHALIQHVQAHVLKKHGLMLTNEVIYLGDWK